MRASIRVHGVAGLIACRRQCFASSRASTNGFLAILRTDRANRQPRYHARRAAKSTLNRQNPNESTRRSSSVARIGSFQDGGHAMAVDTVLDRLADSTSCTMQLTRKSRPSPESVGQVRGVAARGPCGGRVGHGPTGVWDFAKIGGSSLRCCGARTVRECNSNGLGCLGIGVWHGPGASV